jgi:hypothetical protein
MPRYKILILENTKKSGMEAVRVLAYRKKAKEYQLRRQHLTWALNNNCTEHLLSAQFVPSSKPSALPELELIPSVVH